jgi:hypothetical protein
MAFLSDKALKKIGVPRFPSGDFFKQKTRPLRRADEWGGQRRRRLF